MSTLTYNHTIDTFTPPLGRMLQRKCSCGQHTGGGECEECRKKSEGTLQRAAVSATAANAAPTIVHDVLNSPGQPLDAGTRAFMEPRFGHDFSRVRVHTDARAAESARSVNALAYTVGRDVVFGVGQYAPETSEGRWLLTHELTHVVQQSATHPLLDTQNTVQRKDAGIIQRMQTDNFIEEEEEGGIETQESSTEDFDEEGAPLQMKTLHHSTMSTLETEADRAADSIASSQSVSIEAHPVASLARQPQLAPAKKPKGPTICGRASTRVSDYPATFISHIDVDLTSPTQGVTLTWSGPNAGKGARGPFHGSPGAGLCSKNCDNEATSKTPDSDCTPKVTNELVNNHQCHFSSFPEATDVTLFSRPGVGLHFYPNVPNFPASHGCVRIQNLHAAQLIHDNTVTDSTTVTVSGTWKRGKKHGKPVCWPG